MKKIIFVLLLAVLMLFVSCGKSESKTSSTSGTATETSTKTAEKKKIEINVGINTGWDTLSPFRSNIGNNLPVISTITYESLGYLDGSNTLVPWIAKEWKTEDNGVTLQIAKVTRLHPKILFGLSRHQKKKLLSQTTSMLNPSKLQATIL